MFDGPYFQRNQTLAKNITDFYGYKFFYFKRILDAACGHCDIGGCLYRLGADLTALDSRQEHLKVVSKKFPGIKTIKANLDNPLPFPAAQNFDMILDLGLLCHLSDYEKHLRDICSHTTHLVLETAVCDSNDDHKCLLIQEDKSSYDLSYNGQGCRPSPAAIERVLKECGMNFKRMDNSKLNTDTYKYDWQPQNDNSTSLEKRRLWFCVKDSSPIQFKSPDSELAYDRSAHINAFAQPLPPILPAPIPTTASAKPPPSARPNPTKVQMPDRPKETFESHEQMAATIINPAPELGYNATDKKFVLIIPSYNNERYCERNIASALSQNYTNYRVIFTDDCSSDQTFAKVSTLVSNSPQNKRATLIKNNVRIGALANIYNMIYSCSDDEIVLTVDGDDWLANNEVLNKLNQVYSNNDIWMTYGQYQNSTDKHIGIAKAYPANIVNGNSFRSYAWLASHLRTFYVWLFKKIRREDLMKDGKFYQMTWDFAMMFPILEMSGTHSQFISDILYIYNLENPINDHKVNGGLQQKLDKELRNKPKYMRVQEKPNLLAPPKVGLLLIATAKYQQFLQGIIRSADSFFLPRNMANVSYYIFSDSSVNINSTRRIEQIHIDHKPFPFASMDRFKHFTNNRETLSKEDYLYYVDVDCLFKSEVGREIFGNLVGVQHCGYYNLPGPVEKNPKSCLYISNSYGKHYKNYYGGGFSGGKANNYLDLSKWCYDRIEEDVANNIIPIWHDETALNRYFLDHEPNIILSPAYHFPQSDIEKYRKIWRPNSFQPKILLLDKNHSEVRKE
jgi:glycosyltransferase involved in cell wall biosynthesis/SAM-dependent methyltransferase